MATMNEKSSPTADNAAYMRAMFTEIPNAKQIYEIARELEKEKGVTTTEKMRSFNDLAPYFEARYLLTDKFLKSGHYTQVLELAAGLSTRGLTMTSSDECALYTELDLAENSTFKRQVIRRARERRVVHVYNDLFFQEGNALSMNDLEKAVEGYNRNRKLAVVCEGLLRYIGLEDKKELARNIRKLLLRYDGVWMTPDIEVLRRIDVISGEAERYDRAAKVLGYDIRENLWRDLLHAREFFEECGLDVSCYSLEDIRHELVSPRILNMTKGEVDRVIFHRPYFVMKPMKGAI